MKPGVTVTYTWLDSSGNPMDYDPYEVGTYTLLATVPETDYNYAMDNVPVATLIILKPVYPHTVAKTVYITADDLDNPYGVIPIESLFESLEVPEGVNCIGMTGPASPILNVTPSTEDITYFGYSGDFRSGTDTFIVHIQSDNYDSFGATLTFVIKDRLQWSFSNGSQTYSGSPYPGHTGMSVPPDHGGTFTFAYAGTTRSGSSYDSSEAPTDAGSYRATVTFTNSDKYQDDEIYWDFSILPMTVSPTVSVEDNGNKVIVSCEDVLLVKDVDYTLDFDMSTDPTAACWVYVDPVSTSNYTFSRVAAPFTLEENALPVIFTHDNQVYDGTPYSAYEIQNLPTDHGGTFTYTYTGTTRAGVSYNSSTPPTDAGEYHVTVDFTGSDKYRDTRNEWDFTVNPKTIVPDVAEHNGGEITVTYEGATLQERVDYTLTYDMHIDGGSECRVYVDPVSTNNFTFDQVMITYEFLAELGEVTFEEAGAGAAVITDEVTDEVGDAAADEVTEEVTEEVSEEIIDEVTEEVTEEVADEVTDAAAGEVTDEVTDESTEEVLHEIPDRGTAVVTGEDAAMIIVDDPDEDSGEGSDEEATEGNGEVTDADSGESPV